MKIKFLGAVGTVTGSSYVLTSEGGTSILIDFGIFQGPAEIEKLNYEPVDFDLSKLTAVILTHAHLDHCGRLPLLISNGFKGNIWMTPPTRDLTEITLYDSAKLAKEDNKQALFNHDLAVATILKFETLDYHTPKRIGDFEINFRDAGHLLGSVTVEVEDGSAKDGNKKIVFSGDLGNAIEDLEKDTENIDHSDAVVIESTYGNRLHPNSNPEEDLYKEINEVEKTGGTLLIPAFSLDRTQELLHMIMHLKREGKMKESTPVFLDSPMAEKATRVYVNYPKNFNPHVQNELKIGGVFDFPGLNVVGSGQQSQAIHQIQGTKVIIAGSGMMMGGRIRNHAAFYLPMESTRLFVVGYQAKETLGRLLLEGAKEVDIDGVKVSVKAAISQTESMSSHADQKQLLNWLKQIKGVKKVFVTHGEDNSRTVFSQKIEEELKVKDIVLPIMNQEFVV